MIVRVLDALRAAQGVEQIAVVAQPTVLAMLSGVTPVEAGGRMVDNLQRGIIGHGFRASTRMHLRRSPGERRTFEELMRQAQAQESGVGLPHRAARPAARCPAGAARMPHCATANSPEATPSSCRAASGSRHGPDRRRLQRAQEPNGAGEVIGPGVYAEVRGKRLSIADVAAKASSVVVAAPRRRNAGRDYRFRCR
jgi:hypothetical protein